MKPVPPCLLSLCILFLFSFRVSAADAVPDFLWAQAVGGTETDAASAIAVDAQGNAYVAGSFGGSATFGATVLTSAGDSDLFIAKYGTTGVLQWARRAGGTGADAASGIAVDGAGNIYVTGQFSAAATFDAILLRSAGETDLFVAKYDAAGAVLWVRRAGGIGVDSGSAVAVDAAGNAIVAGHFTESAGFGASVLISSGGADAVLAKYDASGNQLWVRKGGGSGVDAATGVAVDGSGNGYVTGFFSGNAVFGSTSLSSSGGTDVFAAKYDESGRLLWVQKGGGMGDDFGHGIAVDAGGSAYITGSFRDRASFNTANITGREDADAFVAKYNSAGQIQWARQGSGVDSDAGQSIGVDASGNAYIAGVFGATVTFAATNLTVNLTSAGSGDVFVSKFDTAGNLLWAVRGGGDRFDMAHGIAVDSAGDIYLCGLFGGAASFDRATLAAIRFEDAFTAKLAANRLPVITSQPRGQVVLPGSNVALSVAALGTHPLRYQWLVNNEPIPSQTNSTLLLPSISGTSSGVYSVVVSNLFGAIGSAPATVIVTDRQVRVENTLGFAGDTIAVPISLVGLGDENTVSFSLAFDTALLRFHSVSNGVNAPSGLNVIANTNSTQAGRLGVALALPVGTQFPFSTNQLLRVYFQAAAGQGTSNSVPIVFTNTPIGFEVVAADVSPRPTVFQNGVLRLEDGLESDLSPRPSGDKLLTTADWTLVGRLVAGLSTVTNASEFARADSAPVATRGDGRLTAADWTQAGRDVAGIDGVRTTGGPTSPAPNPASLAPSRDRWALLARAVRQLRLRPGEQSPGNVASVPVQFTTLGNENALGFSVSFDPQKLQFKAAKSGPGATGVQIILNTRDTERGRLGVLAGLSPGQNFSAGVHEPVILEFTVRDQAPAGDTPLGFANEPVVREVVSADAAVLATDYVDGTLKITGSATPRFSRSSRRESDGAVELMWSAAAGQFRLEASTNLSDWKAIAELKASDGALRYVDAAANQHRVRFFRLIRVAE